MTPDEINRAIAESVGWEPIPEGCFHPDNPVFTHPPNYHGDLNACVEFEAFMRGTDKQYENDWYRHRIFVDYQYRLMSTFGASAPASARCEACLRTIGKWRSE